MARHHLPLARGSNSAGQEPLGLPETEAHQRETDLCTYCPKLCRSTCPVSTTEGRETSTPWALMTTVHHMNAGRIPLTPVHAKEFWNCTGCMRCETQCDHNNRVAQTLSAARASSQRAGVAPVAAAKVLERHNERQERARNRARKYLGNATTKPADTYYVPGCTASALDTENVGRLHQVLEGWLGATRVVANACCGLPLLEAGDRAGFKQAAARFRSSLAGAKRVIFQDPGCQHALSVQAAQLGEPGLRTPHEHLSETAARRLSSVAFPQPAFQYHDPCRLGRGLSIFDAPRTVLARVSGQAPLELVRSKRNAPCSGAGGQLPRTNPKAALGIAQDVATLRKDASAPLVTSCPGARRQFERAGVDARDLGWVIADAVLGTP